MPIKVSGQEMEAARKGHSSQETSVREVDDQGTVPVCAFRTEQRRLEKWQERGSHGM